MPTTKGLTGGKNSTRSIRQTRSIGPDRLLSHIVSHQCLEVSGVSFLGQLQVRAVSKSLLQFHVVFLVASGSVLAPTHPAMSDVEYGPASTKFNGMVWMVSVRPRLHPSRDHGFARAPSKKMPLARWLRFNRQFAGSCVSKRFLGRLSCLTVQNTLV